jgi:hypothetical protein
MNNYPGSSAIYPPSVRIPEGTDRRNTTNLAAGFEDLSNRTAFLHARIAGVADLATIAVPLELGYTAAPSVWGEGVSADKYWMQNQLSNNRLLFDITALLPQVCTISGYGFVVDPASGHGARPVGAVGELLRRPWTAAPDAAWSVLSLVTDPTGEGPPESVSNYQATHIFGSSGMVENVNKVSAYRWAIAITGESGVNAVVGLALLTAYVQVGPV